MSSASGAATAPSAATPKAPDLFPLWRFYSREIEADLARYYQIDIRDWYLGVVDSRRVLTLLDGLPDESSFKTWAMRAGDWPESQYITARLVNEMALARADGKGYMPQLVMSPHQIAAESAEDDYRLSRHRDNLRALRGEEVGGGDHP